MKITRDKTEESQAFLTIEMDAAETEAAMDHSLEHLGKKARVPGFRKGKAPKTILKQYIDKESILEEALNHLVPETYEQALKEQELEPLTQPRYEIVQTEPITFKVVVPLRPTIKLGDYQSIKVEKEEVKIEQETIDAVVEQLQHQHATWEPVDRPVEMNDLIVMDVASTVEGEPFINQKGAQFQVLAERDFPAPGFSDQLVGMKAAEEKKFTLQLAASGEEPEEAEEAGKDAEFTVTITEIKKEVLPELNEEFAKTVNPEFENMDMLLERVKSDLQDRAEQQAETAFEENVLDAVIDVSEMEFPPVLVDSEIHRILDQRFQGNHEQMEAYLASIGKTEEEAHEELRPIATTRVKRSLIMGTVATENKIEVTEADIEAEIERATKDTGENMAEMIKFMNRPEIRESIEQKVLSEKTVQLLKDIALDSGKTEKPKKAAKPKKVKKEDKEENDE